MKPGSKTLTTTGRYFRLLGWLLAQIWQSSRRVFIWISCLDLCALGIVGITYMSARDILTTIQGGDSLVINDLQLSISRSLGIAASLILFGLIVQGTCQLFSRKFALWLVGDFESMMAEKLISKLSLVESSSANVRRNLDPNTSRKLVMGLAKDMGTSARLIVMAASSLLMSIFFIVLAIYFSPHTTAIILGVGIVIFVFLLVNNRRIVGSARKYRESILLAQTEAKKLFTLRDPSQNDIKSSGLKDLYQDGLASTASHWFADRLFRIYLSKFIVNLGAAFAVFLAIILPLLYENDPQEMLKPLALSAGGLFMLWQGFNIAGNAVTFITRLNLKYEALVDCRIFLQNGDLPRDVSNTDDEEEV